jgi:hypothetical protein
MDCNMALSNNDPPFKERKPLKGQNWAGGNTAAIGLWPDPYGRPPIMNEVDRSADVQTKFARNARAAKPAEKALCAAIVAERGDGPAEKPWREANVILDPVNRRVKSDGYDSVGIDVVYRRLKDYRVLKERVNTL